MNDPSSSWVTRFAANVVGVDYMQTDAIKNPYDINIIQSIRKGVEDNQALSLAKVPIQRCVDTLHQLKRMSTAQSESVHWMDAQQSYYSRCVNPWIEVVCHTLWCFFGCKRIHARHADAYLRNSRITQTSFLNNRVIIGSYVALSKALYLSVRSAVDIETYTQSQSDSQSSSGFSYACTWKTGRLIQAAVVIHCKRALMQVFQRNRKQVLTSNVYDRHILGRSIELALLLNARTHSTNARSLDEPKDDDFKATWYATRVLQLVSSVDRIEYLLRVDPEMYPLVAREAISPFACPVFKCRDNTARILPSALRKKENEETKSKADTSLPSELAKAARAFRKSARQWVTNVRHTARFESNMPFQRRFSIGCQTERIAGMIHSNVLKRVQAQNSETIKPVMTEDILQRARAQYKDQFARSGAGQAFLRECGMEAEIKLADALLWAASTALMNNSTRNEEEHPINRVVWTVSLRRAAQQGDLKQVRDFIQRDTPPPVHLYGMNDVLRIGKRGSGTLHFDQTRRTVVRMILYASGLALVVGDLRVRYEARPQESELLLATAVRKLQSSLKYLSSVGYVPAQLITDAESWIMNPPLEWIHEIKNSRVDPFLAAPPEEQQPKRLYDNDDSLKKKNTDAQDGNDKDAGVSQRAERLAAAVPGHNNQKDASQQPQQLTDGTSMMRTNSSRKEDPLPATVGRLTEHNARPKASNPNLSTEKPSKPISKMPVVVRTPIERKMYAKEDRVYPVISVKKLERLAQLAAAFIATQRIMHQETIHRVARLGASVCATQKILDLNASEIVGGTPRRLLNVPHRSHVHAIDTISALGASVIASQRIMDLKRVMDIAQTAASVVALSKMSEPRTMIRMFSSARDKIPERARQSFDQVMQQISYQKPGSDDSLSTLLALNNMLGAYV